MHLNAIQVDVAHDTVEYLIRVRLERNDREAHIENNVASGVLHDTLEVAFLRVEMILDNVNDVAEFLSALANELLINPKGQ